MSTATGTTRTSHWLSRCRRHNDPPLKQLRDVVRADQYGIRTLLDIDGVPIKLKIIHDGRITLDVPDSADQVCGITTLSVGKAATAYGNSLERCLSSAIDYPADNPNRLGECMRALQIIDTREDVLRQRITRLGR